MYKFVIVVLILNRAGEASGHTGAGEGGTSRGLFLGLVGKWALSSKEAAVIRDFQVERATGGSVKITGLWTRASR